MYEDEIMESACRECHCDCEHDWKDTVLDIACHAATWLLGFSMGAAAVKFWLWRWLM